MAKNNKYQINIQQVGSSWLAQITRQITSKKTTVTKHQGDFASESQAKEWADTELAQLLATLVSRNQRHGKNRKQNAEIAEQRSSRRAEKTALTKAQKAQKATEAKVQALTDETGGIDSEVDYDFDEFSEQD